MDPWEAVKWIAIFRLILPDALFRLCGGRVENLGELQPLAVKAGHQRRDDGQLPHDARQRRPSEDRAMFEELGLNVARQPDNGANPRPDNRSGWLDGETPDVVEELLDTPADAEAAEHRGAAVGPVDAAALPAQGARSRRAPTARRTRGRSGRVTGAVTEEQPMTDIEDRLDELKELGLVPPHAHGQRAAGAARGARRQARAAAVLEQLPRPGRPPARARGGGRRGDALGRRRRRVAAGLRAR